MTRVLIRWMLALFRLLDTQSRSHCWSANSQTSGTGTGVSVRAVWKIEDQVQLKGFRRWKSKELAHNLLSRDRQSGSLALYGLIPFFRHPIRHLFKVPA